MRIRITESQYSRLKSNIHENISSNDLAAVFEKWAGWFKNKAGKAYVRKVKEYVDSIPGLVIRFENMRAAGFCDHEGNVFLSRRLFLLIDRPVKNNIFIMIHEIQHHLQITSGRFPMDDIYSRPKEEFLNKIEEVEKDADDKTINLLKRFCEESGAKFENVQPNIKRSPHEERYMMSMIYDQVHKWKAEGKHPYEMLRREALI